MDFVGLNNHVSQVSMEECDDDDIPRTREDAMCDTDSVFYDPVEVEDGESEGIEKEKAKKKEREEKERVRESKKESSKSGFEYE